MTIDGRTSFEKKIRKYCKSFLNWCKNIYLLFPIRKTIVFESYPDFSDNTDIVFRELIDNYHVQDEYKLVWFLGNPKSKDNYPYKTTSICVNAHTKNIIDLIRTNYYQYTASVIIDANQPIHKTRKKQLRVFLGHGMPIKDADSYFSAIGECDCVVTGGNGYDDYFSKYFEKTTIHPFGLPRNEVLFDTKKNAIDLKNKYIIWMPTYRQHISESQNVENSFTLGIPIIQNLDELQLLNKRCHDLNITLFLRLHPIQDTSILKIDELSNIKFADDAYLKNSQIGLYEFIAKSSALVTDYSSVYMDYLLLKRPIGLTFDDYDHYSKKWSFLFGDLRKDLQGEKIYTFNELSSFIESVAQGNDKEFCNREKFRLEMGIEPFNSKRLISEFIYKYLRRNAK